MKNGKYETWRLAIKVNKRWLSTFVGEEVEGGTNITSDIWNADGRGETQTFNVLLMCLHAACPPGPVKARLDRLIKDILPPPQQAGRLQRALPHLDDNGSVDIPF
jgi:hypothetical protein